MRDGGVIEKTPGQVRMLHSGAGADGVDRWMPKWAISRFDAVLSLTRDHRDDQLRDGKALAVARARHKIGSADQLAAIEDDRLLERAGLCFFASRRR